MDTKELVVYILVLGAFAATQGQDILCNDKLLQSLPDDHFNASTARFSGAVNAEPYRARLNTTEAVLNNGTFLLGAWAPTVNDKQQYIQVMFDEMTLINTILTQGRHLSADYVTSFRVEYTTDGTTWQLINNDIGVEQIFQGNSDGDTIQENPLFCPLFVKGIRLLPLEWHTHIAMRFDLNGCYVDNTVIVVTTPMTTVGVAIVTTPAFLPGIPTPFGTGSSLVATTTSPPHTTQPASTVNILTLIHWFMTQLNNNTTPHPTTPFTTTPTTTTKLTTKRPTTTRPTTTKPTTPKPTTKPTTPKPTTKPTTKATTPTTPYVFRPGILDPFGTTKASGLPSFIG